MKKPVVWMFTLAATVLPLGRAVAKPRRDPSVVASSAGDSEGARSSKREKAAENAESPPQRGSQRAPSARSNKTTTKRKSAAKIPCFAPEVHMVRRRGDVLEHRDLALTFCNGSPNPSARDSISVLSRPRDIERPFMPEIRAYQRRPLDRGPAQERRKLDYLSKNVLRAHPDLLTRLQKVASRFAGKTIEVVSGHRPDARDTSRHHHGRALDIRVEGVSRESLRDFLRTLEDTGVGYYPNSYFVHMDVRDKRGYWVDRSGPGEPAEYGTWPPSGRNVQQESERIVAGAMRDLKRLTAAIPDPPAREAATEDPCESHDEPMADELSRDEVARIRAEALSAVEAL